MNKNTGIIIGLIALVVVVGGVYASTSSKKATMIAQEKMEQKAIEDTKMADSDMIQKEDGTTMKSDEIKRETVTMDKEAEKSDVMKVGSYEAYAPEKLARAETGDVVLFFHASWCPSCRGLNSDIENNTGSIPEGLSILKVDYDKETDLKKKYGITYQHTLVQVDKDGNLIKKWSGSPKLSNVISEIQ